MSVMLTFQNGGTEVEGSGVREDGVFAVSHEIFQCSYDDRNNTKSNSTSKSESKSGSVKNGVCYDSRSEKRNDDDKKKEEMKVDAKEGQKDKDSVQSTATAKCTPTDGTCVDLQCIYLFVYVCMYVYMYECMYLRTYVRIHPYVNKSFCVSSTTLP